MVQVVWEATFFKLRFIATPRANVVRGKTAAVLREPNIGHFKRQKTKSDIRGWCALPPFYILLLQIP